MESRGMILKDLEGHGMTITVEMRRTKIMVHDEQSTTDDRV